MNALSIRRFNNTSLIHNEQNETSLQNYKIVWSKSSFNNIKTLTLNNRPFDIFKILFLFTEYKLNRSKIVDTHLPRSEVRLKNFKMDEKYQTNKLKK